MLSNHIQVKRFNFEASFNSEVSNLYFEIEPKFHKYDKKKIYSFDMYRNQMIGDINLDNTINVLDVVILVILFWVMLMSHLMLMLILMI